MAILWGSTFFVLKDTLTRIDASDLLAVRFTIAALVLLVLMHRRLQMDRRTIWHGVVMGCLYGVAQLLHRRGGSSAGNPYPLPGRRRQSWPWPLLPCPGI